MKLHFLALACLLGIAFIPRVGFSQTSVSFEHELAVNGFPSTIDEHPSAADAASVNSRALAEFNRSNPQAAQATWSQDKSGSSVRFVSSGLISQESYDSKGHWYYTIRQVKAGHIPVDVVNKAAQEYPYSAVEHAWYVHSKEGEGYVLTLNDTGDIRMVLVTDEQVQLLSNNGKEK